MASNHKTAHIPNVRERRAKRLANEPVRPEAEAVAQASAASASAEAEAEGPEYENDDLSKVEEVSVGPRSPFEKPITFGSVDG